MIVRSARKLRKALIGSAVAAACLVQAVPAGAVVLWCGTSVNSVTVNPPGHLHADFAGMGVPVLCNVNSPMTVSVGTISPETCRAWYAGLMTALTTKRGVTIAIEYGTSPLPSSCSTIPAFSWTVPNPFPYWLQFDK